MKYLNTLLTTSMIFLSHPLFAEEVVAPGQDKGLWQTMILIGIVFFLFYFILWRPEQKRRKALDEQRSTMKVGDRITAMGIIGKIDKIEDQTVILQTIDGSKIEVLKGAVTDVMDESKE